MLLWKGDGRGDSCDRLFYTQRLFPLRRDITSVPDFIAFGSDQPGLFCSRVCGARARALPRPDAGAPGLPCSCVRQCPAAVVSERAATPRVITRPAPAGFPAPPRYCK